MTSTIRLLRLLRKSNIQLQTRILQGSIPTKSCRPALSKIQCFSTKVIADDDTLNTTSKKKQLQKASLVKDYLDLSKARLSALVVTTTAAGFLAAGGPLSTMGIACLGTALCSCSAAALNQIFEISRDSRMKRTLQRPLVRGSISPMHASLVATSWGVAGTSLLALGTDPYTTALGAGNIVLYAGVYTYMKPRTIYNTWVGAVVGAIPPVIGWSAATGGNVLDIECLLLGATLYLWQMPHFFALSYMYRVDYERGGFKMVPVLEEDGEKTSNLIVRYTWYMSSIPLITSIAGVTSTMFGIEGLALNAYALYVAYDFQGDRTNAKARKVFLTSLWYLPCFLTLFLLHSKTWKEKESEDNIIRQTIDDGLQYLRNEGRQLCIHEGYGNKSGSCPIVVSNQQSQKFVEEVEKATSLTSSST